MGWLDRLFGWHKSTIQTSGEERIDARQAEEKLQRETLADPTAPPDPDLPQDPGIPGAPADEERPGQ